MNQLLKINEVDVEAKHWCRWFSMREAALDLSTEQGVTNLILSKE